jgi:sulfonate transport system ATP-binding protein
VASTVSEQVGVTAVAGDDRGWGVRLHLDGVVKRYSGAEVLRGVNLTVAPGEFVAVVGKSGGGKSTLLRLLAGLDTPSAGQVWVDERPVAGVHRDTRVVFQDARLLPWRRVRANVQLGLPATHRHHADEALRWVGLADKANEWPSRLSGGQRQRVALARALVWRPRLLLMDEPLGALDALTRLEMQRLIERLWLERGFTTLLVTHDISEAIALADRVVLLEDGRLTMDVVVDLARPRQRDARFGELEQSVLDRILGADSPPRVHAVSAIGH